MLGLLHFLYRNSFVLHFIIVCVSFQTFFIIHSLYLSIQATAFCNFFQSENFEKNNCVISSVGSTCIECDCIVLFTSSSLSGIGPSSSKQLGHVDSVFHKNSGPLIQRLLLSSFQQKDLWMHHLQD